VFRARLLAFLALVAAAGVVVLPAAAAGQTSWDLSGTWLGQGGGDGVYVIKQAGATVSWYGHSNDGTSWSHDFTGTIQGDLVAGTFQDRAGFGAYQRGAVSVRVVDACHLRYVSSSVPWGTGLWTKQGCTVAPAVVRTASIASTPGYRVFLGLDDPPVSLPTWLSQTARSCSDLASRAAAFPGVTSNGTIADETKSGVHSDTLVKGQGDFHNLLDAIVPLNDKARRDNVFRRATLGYEPALQAAILGSDGKLEPADVLYYALKVTNGSYPLAVLTAHNLLKDATYAGRDATKRGAHASIFAAKQGELLGELQPAAALAAKLASLRRNPAASADKLGPWYHAFAILSISAFWHPIGGLGAVAREHVFKQLGFFGGSEAGFNLEKAGTDFCFASAASSPSLARLARP
jgi:hypothetical protein